eukprot:899454-Amphidinium_carterae.2
MRTQGRFPTSVVDTASTLFVKCDIVKYAPAPTARITDVDAMHQVPNALETAGVQDALAIVKDKLGIQQHDTPSWTQTRTTTPLGLRTVSNPEQSIKRS